MASIQIGRGVSIEANNNPKIELTLSVTVNQALINEQYQPVDCVYTASCAVLRPRAVEDHKETTTTPPLRLLPEKYLGACNDTWGHQRCKWEWPATSTDVLFRDLSWAVVAIWD